MNNELKNGKMPISSKGEIDELASYRDGVNLGASVLDVDPVLGAYLKKKGFTFRWVNAKKYKNDGGFNANGWRALKMESIPSEVRTAVGLTFGTSAEGYLTRNDLVLAIRTEEKHAQHKALLKQRADLANGDSKFTEKKEALKEALGRVGTVQTGYDDE